MKGMTENSLEVLDLSPDHMRRLQMSILDEIIIWYDT